MSQPATSSRLTNSAVNIIGATTANNTNYGVASIGVTGNNFDISALSTGNNISIGANGTRNVTIGSAASGTVTFPGVTTFTQPVNGGTFTGTAINGTAATTAFTIGSNLTTGSVTIGAQSANTVTIGANSIGATGTVNVGTGSATINIGCTAASAIVLGRTGGSVTLGPPLTLGAAPTTNVELGYTTQVLNGGSATTSTTGSATLATFSLPTLGTWIVNVSFANFSAAANTVMSLSTTTGADLTRSGGLIQQSYGSMSAVFTVLSATTIYLVSSQTTLAVSVNPIHIRITRIG